MVAKLEESAGGYRTVRVRVVGEKVSEVVAAIEKYQQKYDWYNYGTQFGPMQRDEGEIACIGFRSTSPE